MVVFINFQLLTNKFNKTFIRKVANNEPIKNKQSTNLFVYYKETTLKLEESMKAYEKVSLAHAEEKRELSQKEAKVLYFFFIYALHKKKYICLFFIIICVIITFYWDKINNIFFMN
jgi:hypothetical protein